jgi:hypothetical protein
VHLVADDDDRPLAVLAFLGAGQQLARGRARLEVQRILVALDVGGEVGVVRDHRLHLVERQPRLVLVAGEHISLAADHAFDRPEQQPERGKELALAVLARDPQPQAAEQPDPQGDRLHRDRVGDLDRNLPSDQQPDDDLLPPVQPERAAREAVVGQVEHGRPQGDDSVGLGGIEPAVLGRGRLAPARIAHW